MLKRMSTMLNSAGFHAVSCIFGRFASVGLLKASGEVAGTAETCLLGNFGYCEVGFGKHVASTAQAYVAYEIARRLLEKRLELAVEAGALHAQILGELFDGIARGVYVLFHKFDGMGNESGVFCREGLFLVPAFFVRFR